MRRILLNQARDKKRKKRGGGKRRINLDCLDVAENAGDEEILALDEALERLMTVNKPCAELIKLRFFAGLTQAEAAAAMHLPQRTAARYWTYARAWLYQAIRNEESSEIEEKKQTS